MFEVVSKKIGEETKSFGGEGVGVMAGGRRDRRCFRYVWSVWGDFGYGVMWGLA